MCGWNNGIAYRGDDQNTEFDALQVTLAQAMKNGLSMNANYEWASAFDEESGYYTWSHSITHGRDSNVRDQQLTTYGSYDFPFGKGKKYMAGANHAEDLIVGGWQISDVSQWSGGLPYTLGYNESGSNINGGPGYPTESKRMSTALTAYVPNGKGTGSRSFYPKQVCSLPNTGSCSDAINTNIFSNPGLDHLATRASTLIVAHGSSGPTSVSPRHSLFGRCCVSSAWTRSTPSTTSLRVTRAATSSRPDPSVARVAAADRATTADRVSLSSLSTCSSKQERSRSKPRGGLRLPSFFWACAGWCCAGFSAKGSSELH